MPKNGKFQTYNGVRVEEKRIGDSTLFDLSDRPSYEGQYSAYIREYVEPGDSIVVIGGYYGVSTVVAATHTGNDGSVITFVATRDGADRVRKTAKLNNIQKIVTVNAASVGKVYQLKGRDQGPEKIPPGELPDCDVLAIDCDGCELDVLDGLEIRPRIIIVEHHGELDDIKKELVFEYQRENIENELRSKNYTIIDEFTQARSRGGFNDHIGWFVAERDNCETE